MRYILPLLVLCLPCFAADFSRTPGISTHGHQLLVDGKPLRGIFVMWHAGKVDEAHDEAFYRVEFRKMKALGISGVHFEIGWNTLEPRNGDFDFETHGLDKVISWAADEGLWVALLLTPHYTPGWVFTKHGDIRMKTPEGKDADGSFLTLSPSSPAVDDQIAFQRRAIRHYERFPNVLAFFLTNEQGYGSHWADHSEWARRAWVRWLGRSAEIPRSEEDALWDDWLLFRRQELNRYFNRLYDGAASARSRFIPIGHKFVFYNAFDAFARQWGLHISPLQTKMDIAACDAYGSSHVMYAGQLAQGKPVLLAESNFWSTPDGDGGRGKMARMLLDQYFHGVQVQTVYAWNDFDSAKFPWGLHHPGGKPLTGTLGIKAVADILAGSRADTGLIPAEAGIIVPTRLFSRHSDWHWVFQHPLSDALSGFDKFGIHSRVIYSDDIVPSAYPGRSGQPIALNSFRVILAVSDFGEDSAAYESADLRKWVREGGVLFMESRRYGAPAWTDVTETPIEPSATYSNTGETRFWRVRGCKTRNDVAGKLTSAVPGCRILARWDCTDDVAVIAVPHGKGWVVYAGIHDFGDMGKAEAQRLLWDVLALAGCTPPALPIGPTYLIMGDLLYIRAGSDWQGKARIPAGFAVERLVQYDTDAQEMPPTIAPDGPWLKGSLAKDEFCIITLQKKS